MDALASQSRIILHLECKHTVSITALDLQRAEDPRIYSEATHAVCSFCPDAPVEVHAPVKTATQLWKEAGEP